MKTVGASRSSSQLAEEIVRELDRRGLSIATAESLTGGLVVAALVEVPGASAVLRGGVVAYATGLKHDLLRVDESLLAEHGAIHPDVAVEMAVGVRELCGSDYGIATTGVAGPEPQDGHAVGEVYVAVVTPTGSEVRGLMLAGDRAHVRAQTVQAALELVREQLSEAVRADSLDPGDSIRGEATMAFAPDDASTVVAGLPSSDSG